MECSYNVRFSFFSYFLLSLFPLHHLCISGNNTQRICSPLPYLHFHQHEQLTCLWNRLTGLLSFMLSDEMTTGSVTSSESHKRAFAARSHSWNIAQPRFKDAFPEVSDLLKHFTPLCSWICSYFDPVGLIVVTIPSLLLIFF